MFLADEDHVPTYAIAPASVAGLEIPPSVPIACAVARDSAL
jgi:hypothetical protein